MEEGKFNRLVTALLLFFGVVDVVAGAGFALAADYFGYDRLSAWIAGGLFVFMGIGLLAFVAIRGRRGRQRAGWPF
jgi:hypothetical protein